MKCVHIILSTFMHVYLVGASSRQGWSHYSSIGYDIPKHKDDPFLGLGKFWMSHAEDPDTVFHSVTNDKERSHQVAHSATPCGAELWSAMKYDGQSNKLEMLGFEPHFFGSSRIAVNVEECNEDHSGCEAWLKTRTDYPGQLEFSCPNYLLYKNRLKKRPNIIVQMAAFAEQINTCDSVKKFDEEQSKGFGTASNVRAPLCV